MVKVNMLFQRIVFYLSIFILAGNFSLWAQEVSYSAQCIQVISQDEEDRKLSYPSSLFYDPVKDEIYLIDSGNSRILIYTFDFFPLFTLDKDDGIVGPTCVAVDTEGYLFVGQSASDRLRARISIFNPCLKWKRDIYFKEFNGAEDFIPLRISLDREGKIYLAGTNHIGAVVFSGEGEYLYSLAPKDEFMGVTKEVKISDVEVADREGKIYLLSEDRGRVYIYNKAREFLFKFGEKGGSSGKMSRPRGLAVDSLNGRIYTIDYMRHTANVYDNHGEYLFEFGGKGWGEGWFQFPSDICIDGAGNALAADTFNNRVQVFEIKKIHQ